MPSEKLFDAFLSHNNNDKPAVEQIAIWLRDQAKLTVWFDKWNILPGDVWQEEIEKALDQSRSCVVFLGPTGLGGWQNEETRTAIADRVAHKDMRVIPVWLPNTRRPEKESELPSFLRRHSFVEFRHGLNDPEALQRLAAGIAGKQTGESASRLYETVCPFRGLEVFREEHAEFFFGRESVVQRLQDYLQEHRFLAVIGPSGSGKSSVVQAGLIPALKRRGLGAEGGGRRAEGDNLSLSPSALRPLHYALFTPQSDPFEGLAFALRPLMAQPPSYSQLIKDLTDNEKELEYIARGICRDKGEAKLLLVIDQFEEVFTQTSDEQRRQRFFDSLLNTVEAANCPTLIVLTMRSDFLGKCAAYADLNTFIIDHLFQIGPMSAKDLREAIEEPAQRVGLEFEKGLVEIMLRDAAGAPGELPLIEHALLELYERRSGNQLTQAAYEEIGGISGALAKRAEAEFACLAPAQQEILRKMFVLRLIQPGEGTEDTRRRATKEELLAVGGNAKEAEAVLQQWTNARLLTTTRDEEKKQEIVDVAHETLIRTWPKVKEWLKDERENIRLIGQLHQAVQEWARSNYNDDYLYQGVRLAQIEDLHKQFAGHMTELEKKFIFASIDRRDADLLEKEKQRQALANTLARNYWESGRAARLESHLLKSILLMAEAVHITADEKLATDIIRDAYPYLSHIRLRDVITHHTIIEGCVCDMNQNQILVWSNDNIATLWQILPGKLLQKNLTHNDWIIGAKFSHDGSRVLTWSKDGEVKVWDVASAKQIGVSFRHEDRVRGAFFNHTGTRVFSWGDDRKAKCWDAESGTLNGHVMQHNNAVVGALLTRDETRLLTWSIDNAVNIWQLATGLRIGATIRHEKNVSGAIFNKDETKILTWSWDKTARIWDAATGDPIGPILKHEGWVLGAAFCRDENRILTWSRDCTSCLWNVANAEPIALTLKHEGPVLGAILNNNEKRILTWSKDGTAKLWNVKYGQLIGQPMRHEGEVHGAAFHQDETQILTWGADRAIRLWSASTCEPISPELLHDSPVKDLVFFYKENLSVNWGHSHTVRIWEFAHGKPTAQTLNHEGWVHGAEFSKDEQLILTWSDDCTVRLWKIENNNPTCSIIMKHDGWVRGAIFNREETRILSWGNDAMGRLWDSQSGTQIGSMPHQTVVTGAIFSYDESCILTWGWDNTARLWNASDVATIGPPMTHNGHVNGAIFNKTQTHILTWSNDGTARLWRISGGVSNDLVLKHNQEVRGAVFDKAETKILTWSNDGTARLWDLTKDTYNHIEFKHQGSLQGAIFSQEESFIVTWSTDNSIRLWDTTSGRLKKELRHDGPVIGAILSSDNFRMLTWSTDNTVRLWELTSGILVCPPLKHDAEVEGAIFNRDETFILTWSKDKTARLWDAASGAQIGPALGHLGPVFHAIFNQDETLILTCSTDRSAKLWNISGDLDFPKEQYKQKIMVLTGTRFDPVAREIKCIDSEEWQGLTDEYLQFAREHRKNCKYASQNLYSWFFPDEVKK